MNTHVIPIGYLKVSSMMPGWVPSIVHCPVCNKTSLIGLHKNNWHQGVKDTKQYLIEYHKSDN